MAAGNNGTRQIATLLKITSTASAIPPTEAVEASQIFPYKIKAGIILSRAPRITRDLTPFEKSFYFYQRRLNERLALPFTRYFYFKRGTPVNEEWKRKFKDRQTPARDIGKYNAYAETAWNDELIVGATESEPQNQVDALVRDAEGFSASEYEGEARHEEIPKPLPRVSEADTTGDEKSLDRAMQRTLYLLVKVKQGYWKFPSVTLDVKENVRAGAERSLVQSVGPNMNVWTVGYHPVSHYVQRFTKPIIDTATGAELKGEKTFFLKGRILAGQADVTKNMQDVVDFKWLSKEEVQKHVMLPYWSAVQNALSER
ncbi:mitochondrial 54S ribosomal protein YmL17/YmL30 [Arthroderma uncinatum]|uniref:mitochondrial 54S ribosomal protein YmL17/YmL30 n=1 Tax=Arthroderma uncinatum TaxID=74035 RepID=UPI00144AE4AC|nr:mitochondrial 54S ribosomal protein YmL17/YmL30 [Arthroderma uncinatum]KAF3483346.1 mitochondrial 54S ribosomal protein YmL17/YmL30 [Arthroderma uncinatum]